MDTFVGSAQPARRTPPQFGCEATRMAAPITSKCVTMKRAKGGSNFIVWASGVIRTINPRLPPLVPEWGLCRPGRSCPNRPRQRDAPREGGQKARP
jgi:hypothetical protein